MPDSGVFLRRWRGLEAVGSGGEKVGGLMDLPVFPIGSADRDFRLYRQILILDRAVDDHDRAAFENECFSHFGMSCV
jgi:hypothetical protein